MKLSGRLIAMMRWGVAMALAVPGQSRRCACRRPNRRTSRRRFRRLGQKLSAEHGVVDEVAVHGTARALKAVVAVEACRIGSKALLNAFRHTRAKRVEV